MSDLLGQHTLMTAIQTTTTTEGGNFLNSLGGTVGYLNQKSRWNRGIVGGQAPYLTGRFGQGFAELGGRPVYFEQETNYRQIYREISGVVSYPFNRAKRVEFTGGYQNISRDAATRTYVYDALSGAYLGQTDFEDIPTPDALNLTVASAALVYDTAIFGGTSPVFGQAEPIFFAAASIIALRQKARKAIAGGFSCRNGDTPLKQERAFHCRECHNSP